MVERFRQDCGEERFRREYLAEFTDGINNWIAPEQVDACVVQGRTELPPTSGVRYFAAVDPAFQRSDFALVVLHKNPDGVIVMDKVRTWAGTRSAPLGFDHVMGAIGRILGQYGVRTIVGDQYCAPFIREKFLSLGLRYETTTFSRGTREQIFSNLKHLLVQQEIELLDDSTSLDQLHSLEERKNSSGNIGIRAPNGTKDDLAVALALGAFNLCERKKQFYYGMI